MGSIANHYLIDKSLTSFSCCQQKTFCALTNKLYELGPKTLRLLGALFASLGTGLYLLTGYYVIASLSLALAGGGLLYAGQNVNNRMIQQVVQFKTKVKELEEEGNYFSGLAHARKALETAKQVNDKEGITFFSDAVVRLEEKLLNNGMTHLLFDEQFAPKLKLIKLLNAVGYEEKEKYNLTEINEWCQQNIIRKGERWDPQEKEKKFEDLKDKIKPFFKDLGFVDGVQASFKEYEGALLHGALLVRVRLRLQFLIEEWKRGVRFKHLYFLTGARPLLDTEKSKEALNSKESDTIPQTEKEMMEWVWKQTDIPEDMRKNVETHYVNAPMKGEARPTREDTIDGWLNEAPTKGKYLSVTNLPYVVGFDLAMRSRISKDYQIDTVGQGLSEKEKMVIIIDEVARSIYEGMKYKNKKEST